MNCAKLTTKELCYIIKPMDVLWGTWAKHIKLNEAKQLVDLTECYESIHKEGKKDFPFTVDLQVLIAYQSKLSESNQEFRVSLDIIDDIGQYVHSEDRQIVVPEAVDTLIRWYESYIFSDVKIIEPRYHQLSILINGEEKHVIPLYIFGHKITILDSEKDSTTEMWYEDWNPSD